MRGAKQNKLGEGRGGGGGRRETKQIETTKQPGYKCQFQDAPSTQPICIALQACLASVSPTAIRSAAARSASRKSHARDPLFVMVFVVVCHGLSGWGPRLFVVKSVY